MARYGPKPRPVAERFWDHVRKGDLDECWEWTGARERAGYGFLHASHRPRRWWKAHRVSWEIHFGAIPQGACVLHRCDNPPCVNPRHLWLGSRRDNNRDRVRKGRGHKQHGEANTNAKLSAADLPAIRRLHERGMTQEKIAEVFSISQPQISRVLRGESWGHLRDR